MRRRDIRQPPSDSSTATPMGLFLLGLLVALAALDFVLVDLLAFLDRGATPAWLEGFARLRGEAAPMIANALLITVVLVQMLLLPHLVKRSAGGRTLGADRLLVVVGLLLLGLAALRSFTGEPSFLLGEHALLVASYALVAARMLRARAPRPWIAVGIGIVLALITPLVWRLALEKFGSGSGVVTTLRRVADAGVLLALAATALLAERRRSRLLIAAAIPALLLWVALVVRFVETRSVIAAASGLWLTTLPPFVVSVLVALAIFGVAALILTAWRSDRQPGFAAAIALWCLAGFLPIRPENVLLAFTATVVLSSWSDGKVGSRQSLARLLSLR